MAKIIYFDYDIFDNIISVLRVDTIGDNKMTNKKQDPYYEAQNILSRRDHSEAEIRQKMKRKGFFEKEINEVIDWLYAQKLLDDKRFALLYAESVLLGKPIGPRWIKLKLKQRGLQNSVIEQAIAEIYRGEREAELVRLAASRWLKINKDKNKQSEKLTRFLLSRGFSYESIRDIADDF